MAARPTLADIEAARRVIGDVVRVTPAQRSETLTALAGRPVWLKAENLQRTGSFKVRGAVNRIAALAETERRAGVVAASAGNHGQAVAWAAREAGVEATVFMPEDAALAKVEATKGYGATVRLGGDSVDECVIRARAHCEETAAVLVHPFDDVIVVAGQGTLGLELHDQLPELETVVVPVGGGGLASGIAIALSELRPGIRIVGVQAERCAPFAGREHVGYTIADDEGVYVTARTVLVLVNIDTGSPRRIGPADRAWLERVLDDSAL